MINKKEKGEYGYLNGYRREKLTISLILAVMIAFVIVTVLILFGDTMRVVIVFAILLTLPFAKFFVAWIMCAKFEPLTGEQYDALIKDIYSENDAPISGLKFDVVITRYEGMKFYQSICVKNGKIIALVLSKDYSEDKKSYKSQIEQCVSDSKYTVTVYNDITSYAKKVRSISTPNDKTALADRNILDKLMTTCV